MSKRLFDILISLIMLVPSLPLTLVLGILIRLDSKGPAIFRQQRVGRYEKPFTVLKLRTMTVGTPELGTHEVSISHVTGMGAFLRRCKLDELPQLINVLKGEMSLVGPRPCLAVQTELIEARRSLGVFSLRPGITGLAQVEHLDMSDPQKLAARDSDYLKSNGFVSDLVLCVRTLL